MSKSQSRPRIKAAEAAPWLNSGVHVWHTKGGELTVINLRDPTESLREAAPAGMASPGAEPSTAALRSVSASAGPMAGGAVGPGAGREGPAPAAAREPTVVPSAAGTVGARSGGAPAAAPSRERAQRPNTPPPPPPPRQFPEKPVEPPAPRAEPKPAAFEFIAGTNIPGRGVLTEAGKTTESPTLAIFHDPLWGASEGTWSTSVTATGKPSSPAPATTATAGGGRSLFDIFGTAPRPRLPVEPPMAPPPAPVQTASAFAGPGPSSLSYVMSNYPSAAPAVSPPLVPGALSETQFAVNAPVPAYLVQQELYARLAAAQMGLGALPGGIPMPYLAGASAYGVAPLGPSSAVSAGSVAAARAGSSSLAAGINIDAKPFIPMGSV